MATQESNWIEHVRGCRVWSVTDDGVVVVLQPDGGRRTVNVPRDSVSLVRCLAEMDREIEREAQLISVRTPRG